MPDHAIAVERVRHHLAVARSKMWTAGRRRKQHDVGSGKSGMVTGSTTYCGLRLVIADVWIAGLSD
jgi:hypothetical protein